MIATAADRSRLPVEIIEKPKNLVCFQLLGRDEETTLPYKNQKNAWLDKYITRWWIKNMFRPHHLRENGDVNAILILENCTAHDIDQSRLPVHLLIKLFPPNITNRHQPADIGMIAALKAGYKYLYLRELLAIFDAP